MKIQIDSTETIIAPWAIYQGEISTIRKHVFIDEQGVAEEDEWDEHDSDDASTHLLVKGKTEDTFIATARILNSGKISRVAVLKDYRLKGIGSQLVRLSIAVALQNRCEKIYLNSQVLSIDFYLKLGFSTTGNIFTEAGIPHQKMTFDPDSNKNAKNHSDLFLSLYKNSVIRIDKADDFIQQGIQMCLCAMRYIDILSEDLLPSLYSNEQFVNALSQFVRAHRHARVRILVSRSISSLAPHHRLLELSKRISSKIEIKRLNSDIELNGEAYAIFDQSALLYFNKEETFFGFANYEFKSECKNLTESFNTLWNKQSTEDPDARVLAL